MTIATALVVCFAAGAVFFTFVGAVGLLRLPDVYTRAHAASKADTLGAGFAVLAVGVAFGGGTEAIKAGLLLAFVYYTNPTAAHAIASAAYNRNVTVWTRDPKGNADLQRDPEGDGGLSEHDDEEETR